MVEEDPVVAAIHANAEVFDPKAEAVFRYLQVFSAICVTFSHGALPQHAPPSMHACAVHCTACCR